MSLSNDLISQFVKVTKNNSKEKTDTTVYGTAVEYSGSIYVKLDGSDRLTPISTTADVKPGERVMIMIKNHTATVTGNLSSPAARTDTVKEIDGKVSDIGNKISEFEIVIADKVSTKELEAEKGRIDDLVTENVTIKDSLDANKASILELEADNVSINEKLIANDAEIEKLNVDKLDANVADIKFATIENLEATNADIHNLQANYGVFKKLSTDKFTANEASIKDLETNKISAKDIEGLYANIDFSNIGEAAIKKLFSETGMIKDLVVGNGTIAGELVGVTISGDLIKGNTIIAEKLVVKGEDGLYYKLNTDGISTEAEQTDYNSLNGSVIRAKSVTAEKISVNDLVAFGATIGGFKISNSSIYSGVKNSVNNTTRGIYLGNDGQIAFGDGSNFLKYYKTEDGSYRLEISARSLKISTSNKTVEETVNEIQNQTTAIQEQLETEVNTLKDEISTILRINSSRGTVFKNDQVSTVLSVVIYRGSKRITDATTLRETMGASAYLQWSWQRLNEDSYGLISADDSRLGDNGFTFTLNPEDVDTKVIFLCELIV